tara:strand:+ start:42 stop:356 length:315 start_codon:yes stop_codon:yes gene_type:complete
MRGEELRAIRTELGLTQHELAEILGMSTSALMLNEHRAVVSFKHTSVLKHLLQLHRKIQDMQDQIDYYKNTVPISKEEIRVMKTDMQKHIDKMDTVIGFLLNSA